MANVDDWLTNLFARGLPLGMGHHARAEDQNLGLGWLYYALTRIVRSSSVVVIGSYRGFAPIVFAKGLLDNAENGRVVFIDPSYVDDFWRDPSRVTRQWEKYGTTNIDHYRMTTQEFTTTSQYKDLHDVGMVFIDGHHTEEQAALDFQAFEGKLSSPGYILFHDSTQIAESYIYGAGNPYVRTVPRFLERLVQRSDIEILTLPFDVGLSIVRITL